MLFHFYDALTHETVSSCERLFACLLKLEQILLSVLVGAPPASDAPNLGSGLAIPSSSKRPCETFAPFSQQVLRSPPTPPEAKVHKTTDVLPF